MADQVCPQCGCVIGSKSFRKGDIVYCCEPCADNCQCECDCIDESKEPERRAPMKGQKIRGTR